MYNFVTNFGAYFDMLKNMVYNTCYNKVICKIKNEYFKK